MTIAACYLSSEGVVLGADSTSTMFVPGPDGASDGLHHLNYAQKLFEIGTESTLAVTMWGMGSIGSLAHRTLIAHFADYLAGHPVKTMQEVADQFATFFWQEYTQQLQKWLVKARDLAAKQASTPEEQEELANLRHNLSGGYCVGGHLIEDRTAAAFEITYDPLKNGAPQPQPIPPGNTCFWGCPNFVHRVLYSWDDAVFNSVLNSGKWTGNAQDLLNVILQHRIAQPSDLPLREAVDWVHSVIYTTIKAMKFSHHLPVCGGPIEIAVVSTDRKFRWVKHKRFDQAL